MRDFDILCLAVICGLALTACGKAKACATVTFDGLPFTVCEATAPSEIKFFLKNQTGEIYGSFDAVKATLKASDQRLVFAMNGGMYHESRNPVGLYVENGVQASKLNRNQGPGNFHLLPNGVFWIGQDSSGVMTADDFANTFAEDFGANGVKYATQSGPMLVIETKLHPAFREDSKSLRIRNGVGQTSQGQIFFVKSELPVNFHTFARLFRDELKTPNALFLDGTVSKLYSDDLGRNDTGQDMGPIIGVIEAVP